MQFAGSPEKDEDQEAATYPGDPSQALQVYRAAWSIQEIVIPGCVSHGVEA